MADALGTPGPPGGPGVVSALDHRLDQGAMLALTTSVMDVRTGVLHGPGTTALVTGTSATGTMTYSIAPHHWVSSRGPADGVYVGTTEAAQTVPTTAAPGANSRIDVIWEKQQDQYSTLSADATSAPQYGVTQGAAAVSPVKPAIPVGALELATAVVAVGATATNGSGVTITNTARQTVARGARIPVRNQAEQDALTAFKGLEVYRLDNGQVQLCTATGPTAWAITYDPTDTGVWTAFTPTWASTGAVQPSVGSGSLTGRYRLRGKTVEISIALTFASTGTATNGGSGNWSFGGFPAALASREQVVECKAFTAAGNLHGFGLLLGGATVTPYLPSTTATQVMAPVRNADSANPVAGTGIPTIASTFPFSSGHNLVLSGSYEAA